MANWFNKIKFTVLSILALCSVIIILFIFTEFCLIPFKNYKKGDLFRPPPFDKELGWSGRKNFGDIASSKFKIFVLGDSFTEEGPGLDEAKMYYRLLGEKLNAEIFVYSSGGYGTLQEYLALNRYFDEINPDLVILQFCPNDIIDNSWKLENASLLYNNHLYRPYLINGEIKYLYPKFLGHFRVFMSYHSRIFYLLSRRMDKLLHILASKKILHSVEEQIEKKWKDFPPFKEALASTEVIISKIKKRIGQTPLYVFTVASPPIYIEYYREVFKNNNIDLSEDEAGAIEKAEAAGTDVRLADRAHWNENGHRICGEILSLKIKQLHYQKK